MQQADPIVCQGKRSAIDSDTEHCCEQRRGYDTAVLLVVSMG